MNEVEKHKDLVGTNLLNFRTILRSADSANKGRYSHDINKYSCMLKVLLKGIDKKAVKDVTMADLKRAGKYAQFIAGRLWLVKCGR